MTDYPSLETTALETRLSIVPGMNHPLSKDHFAYNFFFFLNNGRLSGVPLYLISGNLCCVWLALSACITRSSLLLQSGVTCDGVAKKEKGILLCVNTSGQCGCHKTGLKGTLSNKGS